MTKEEVIEKILGLIKEKGYLYAIAVMLQHDLIYDAEQGADIDLSSRLNLQELTFLLGLVIKSEIDLNYLPTEEELGRQVDATYKLFEELHHAYADPVFKRIAQSIEQKRLSGKQEAFEDVFGEGNAIAESIFYGGSGAYDFQCLAFALERYKKDLGWILQKKGFHLDTAIAVFTSLKELMLKKIQHLNQPKSFEDFCRACLSIFCFTKSDLIGFDTKEIERIMEDFSVVPGKNSQSMTQPGEYNIIHSHPIVRLDEDLFFLPIAYNLAESIYESPFYWMSGDAAYKDSAFKNRGDSAEEIAYQLLVNVFGKDNLFRQVKVMKSRGETVTDIDLLAVKGNKAAIFQVKSKKLTALSRVGDITALKQDFQEAVQEAYDQAKLCRKAILDKDCKLVTYNGDTLALDDSIDDAYLFCVTTDDYPAITHQVKTYLKKDKVDYLPMAVNLFDLEILAYYLDDPFKFLYYARQRTLLSELFDSPSEISLLGYHLKTKLYPVWDEKSGKKFDKIMVTPDMAQLIDAHFPAAKGHLPKTTAMEKLHAKWSNAKFQQLLDSFKLSKEPRLTDVIFFLYDLAGEAADRLISSLENTKNKSVADKSNHDFSMMSSRENSGVTFVCQYGDDVDALRKRLFGYCELKKYETKADEWFGLGAMTESKNMVDTICYSKSPWQYDETLEALSKKHLGKGRVISFKTGKKVGRNDPCVCGSGKKFKKCHGK